MGIRYSRDEDYDDVKNLVCTSFGLIFDEDVLGSLKGRYLVYETDGKVVAMSGLHTNWSYSSGVEIDWTCTLPAYRGKGIIHELIGKIVESVDTDLYCACWRIGENRINLYGAMKNFGFECVVESAEHVKVEYNCPWQNRCIYYKKGCECYQDVYVRKQR